MKPRLLALIQSPALLQALQPLEDVYHISYHVPWFSSPEAVITLAAELQPVLILIALIDPPGVGGRGWLARLRSDPASRRIPAVGIGEGDSVRSYAQGVNLPLVSEAQFCAEAAPLIEAYQRRQESGQALASVCDQPLPPLVVQGLEAFNAGEYYEAHELLETAWMQEAGPVRDLYRVVLQVGVGYYQIQRGNYEGARKMFLRALQWFAPLPDYCQGIYVARLRADVAAVRAQLEALGAARIGDFDQTLLRPVEFDHPGADNHETH